MHKFAIISPHTWCTPAMAIINIVCRLLHTATYCQMFKHTEAGISSSLSAWIQHIFKSNKWHWGKLSIELVYICKATQHEWFSTHHLPHRRRRCHTSQTPADSGSPRGPSRGTYPPMTCVWCGSGTWTHQNHRSGGWKRATLKQMLGENVGYTWKWLANVGWRIDTHLEQIS